MKKIIMPILLLLWLTACGAPAVGTAQPLATIDPFVAVAEAERTAQAAQDQAQFYSRQLTATAEAPIVAITSTAAAWQMQQQYAQATSQSAQSTETAAITQTALRWTPTPNLTATMNVLALSATSQVMANDVQKDNLSVERARSTNTIYAIAPFAVGLIALLLAAMIVIAYARKLSVIAVPVDARGNPQPMFDVVEGVAFDTDRMVNGALATRRKDILSRLPVITAERQDAVTARDQQRNSTRTPLLSVPVSTETLLLPPQLFPRPAWEIADSWQGGPQLPYGLTANGLGLMDLNQSPHIATIGKTGSGKSRRFLRPLITFALAAGQRVVILGKSVDFLPFADHPNCKMIAVRELTLAAEAERYAMFLKAMVEEMNNRDSYLSARHASTWSMAGRENTLVVLDELGNALDLMPGRYAEVSYRYIKGLVKEGRKVGFNLVMASQRTKGLRDVMTQVGRAVFFVEDEQESRLAGTPGAEQLPEGYFYSKFGAQRFTGAFEPTDLEITSFLSKRMVQPLEPQGWIDAMPTMTAQESLPEPAVETKGLTAEQVTTIRNMQGKSVSAIVSAIWGYTGGDAGRRRAELVRQALGNMETI